MTPARMALAAGAALAALYAAGLLYEIDVAPPGCCALAWPHPDPVQAERVLAAVDPKGVDAAVQGRAAAAVLAASPANASAWKRLAYADRLTNGRLTEAGARALENSYLVEPFAYHQAPWRIGFALENWSGMTTAGREAALDEIALARADGGIWPEVRAVVRTPSLDPSGRMTAALLGML